MYALQVLDLDPIDGGARGDRGQMNADQIDSAWPISFVPRIVAARYNPKRESARGIALRTPMYTTKYPRFHLAWEAAMARMLAFCRSISRSSILNCMVAPPGARRSRSTRDPLHPLPSVRCAGPSAENACSQRPCLSQRPKRSTLFRGGPGEALTPFRGGPSFGGAAARADSV